MMRRQRMKNVGPIVCGALLLGTPAIADAMSVAIQVDGGPLQFYPGVPGYVGVALGPWTVSAQEAAHGFEVNAISSANSTLNVWITGQSFADPYTGSSTLQYFVRTLPPGWSVYEAIYTDQGNGAFSGNLLDSDTFTAATPAPGVVEPYALTLDPPYSISTYWHITSAASALPLELTSDINIGHTPTVPAPIVGAGVPGLLAGALALIALMRRRRT